MQSGRVSIACGASYLILPRASTDFPPSLFIPWPFELKPLLEMQSDWAQHVLKGGQRAGQTVWCHGNLIPPTKNLEWLVGPQERMANLSQLAEDRDLTITCWIKHWALMDKHIFLFGKIYLPNNHVKRPKFVIICIIIMLSLLKHSYNAENFYSAHAHILYSCRICRQYNTNLGFS